MENRSVINGDNTVEVAAFYRYVVLDDCRALREPLLNRCRRESLTGTIVLAAEGINGTLAGNPEAIGRVLTHLRGDSRLTDMDARYSRASRSPFRRMKVKVRRELVSPGIHGLAADRRTGDRIEPRDWNALVNRADVLLLDVRNDYEHRVGRFRGSRDLGIENFRDFATRADEELEPAQHPRVAMYCTGGIRCEKASAYLLAKGFREVYQLDGGVLNYLERVSSGESLWQGECFVFDSRVALDSALLPGRHEQCYGCRRPLSAEDMRAPEYRPGVACPYCHAGLSPAQRMKFDERRRQVELAEKRHELHLGAGVGGRGR